MAVLVFTAAATATAKPRPDAEKLLAASHVAVVTIREGGESPGTWNPVDVSIVHIVKGGWRPRLSIWIPDESEGLKQGGRYLVFASENATRERGVTLHAYWDDVVPIDDRESKTVADRLRRTAHQQREALNHALKAAMFQPPPSSGVPEILALLFDRATQREAVRKLLALPPEANRALAMHVYDTRPIPRNLLSPDLPIVSHVSPAAECGNMRVRCSITAESVSGDRCATCCRQS